MLIFGQPYPLILPLSIIFINGLNKATYLLNTVFFAVALFRSAFTLDTLPMTLLFSFSSWRHLGTQSGEAFRDVAH